MGNKEDILAALQELRTDNTKKQKRGLHFIMASVLIWIAVVIIQASALPVLTQNLFTFCCSTPLVPLAYGISRLLKIDFQNRGNPLSGLGLLFALNQMLYILIAMWVYAAVPEKMLIFGAHLLPYGWLYQSKTYYIFSVVISLAALFLGICCSSVVVAVFMLVAEVFFCLCLIVENKKNA